MDCEASSSLPIALRAQSISVDEDTEYMFPSEREIMNLALPNSTLASISLSPEFIAGQAAGESFENFET